MTYILDVDICGCIRGNCESIEIWEQYKLDLFRVGYVYNPLLFPIELTIFLADSHLIPNLASFTHTL